MSPEEAATRSVVACFDALGVPYMVTGSLASTHHGRPRSTHDVDVGIEPSAEALAPLVSRLREEGFYVDEQTAAEALNHRRQFNAIQTETGVKIDLIIRKDRAYSREEIGRRQRAELGGGTPIMLASAEDSILSKLEWARKAGGSEKHLADVLGVLEVQGDRLDFDYIDRWAEPLGVSELWEQVRRERDAGSA